MGETISRAYVLLERTVDALRECRSEADRVALEKMRLDLICQIGELRENLP